MKHPARQAFEHMTARLLDVDKTIAEGWYATWVASATGDFIVDPLQGPVESKHQRDHMLNMLGDKVTDGAFRLEEVGPTPMCRIRYRMEALYLRTERERIGN